MESTGMGELEDKVAGLARWMRGGTAPPFMLEFNPTNQCNCRCLSCYARGKEPYAPDREIPDAKYLEITREATAMGVRRFHIMGSGEPLTRPAMLGAMMEEVKRSARYGSLVTNGTLFDAPMLDRVVEIGWDQILFSLDGPDAETNDRLRGRPGAFEETTGAIRALAERKRARGSEAPWIVMAPVLSSANFDRPVDMVELARATGVDQILLQPIVVPETEEGRPLLLTEDQRRAYHERVDEACGRAGEFGIDENFAELDDIVVEKSAEMGAVIEHDIEEYADDHPLSIPCYQPWVYMSIRVQGQVRPCPMIPDDEDVESVLDRSLEEIWYGDYFNDLRLRLMSGNLSTYCRHCCGAVVLETRRIRSALEPYNLQPYPYALKTALEMYYDLRGKYDALRSE